MSGEEFAVVGTDDEGEWIVDPSFVERKDADECAARIGGRVMRRNVTEWAPVDAGVSR